MTTTLSTPLTRPTASTPYVSLRWKLLALTLTPMLIMGGAWVTHTTTTQASEQQQRLVQGAVQTASVFGQGVVEFKAEKFEDFSSMQIRTGVQQRAQDLVTAGLVPLLDAVVTDHKGNAAGAYNTRFSDDSMPVSVYTDPQGTWNTLFPQTKQAVRNAALSVISGAGHGKGEIVRLDGRDVILAAHALPDGSGSTVLVLDANSITASVQASVQNTLWQLLVVLLVTAAAAFWFAQSLSKRLTRLAQQADDISLGRIDTPIKRDAHDEIGDVAESVERMRTSLELAFNRL